MRLPPDVPVHRGRVGAMRIASGYPSSFKPYVYRGTGVDTLTPYLGASTPAPKRKRRRKPRPKPQAPPYYDTPAAAGVSISEEVLDLAPPEPEPEPTPEPPRLPKRIEPSPGWQPTRGDDIEALLAELEEDDGPTPVAQPVVWPET